MPDYFTLSELRALPDVDNDVRYPDARVEAEAAFVVARIEEFCGASFVSRTVTGELHNGGGYALVLDHPHALSVTSATEDGDAVTDVLRLEDGMVRRYADADSYTPIRWTRGSGNVAVTYERGYAAAPPSDVKAAALHWTRLRLLATSSQAGNDARATSQTTDAGVMQFTVAGPDQPSGYPDVDATLVDWRDKLTGYGFA